MADEYLTVPGDPIASDELTIAKAVAVARTVIDGALPFVRLVACLRVTTPETDVVILDVDPELPQRPVNDIRRTERIALAFGVNDRLPPEPLALRPDFPQVPHLNLTSQEIPRSLCLYDEPWSEAKLKWTVVGQIERLRRWLTLTARGELHEVDQPLEPLLLGPTSVLVLPPDVLASGDAAAPLRVEGVKVDDLRWTYIAEAVGPQTEDRPSNEKVKFVATVIQASPHIHGIIRKQPVNLAELAGFLAGACDDLIGTLRRRLRTWSQDGVLGALLEARLILVLVLPKARHEGDEPEDQETWAFFCLPTIGEMGQALGIWQMQGPQPGWLISPDEAAGGQDVPLEPLNPMAAFTRERAATLNGLDRREDLKLVAVGVGALGSQVFVNLMRSGYGEWTLVDDDIVLPHNLARHAVFGALGGPKAEVVAYLANATIAGAPIARAITADVSDPMLRDGLVSALRDADVILDTSASIAVARGLARDVESNARRASLFLNLTGTDGVLLAEDLGRTLTLDVLEMQYYRAAVTVPELAEHLALPIGRMRYGIGCRDQTSRMPQELVALHAAVGSRAVRTALADDGPTILIWQAHEDLSITPVRAATAMPSWYDVGEWKLCVDQAVLETVARFRQEKLPNETGGILVGAFDTQRRIAYVVDALPSPADSVEWPTLYIRGCRELNERVAVVEQRSAGNLRYIGEWHSHPNGHGVMPSDDDRKVFVWIGEAMLRDGLPPLMLIASANEHGWYLDHLP